MDWSAKPFFRHGMATFGDDTTRISDHQMERAPSGRECLLCGGDGKFRASGSDRAIFFAYVRRRLALAIDGARGPDGLRSLSKENARPTANKFWIYLWFPLLKHFAG